MVDKVRKGNELVEWGNTLSGRGASSGWEHKLPKFIILIAILFINMGCVRCLLNLPPTAKSEIQVLASMPNDELFNIIQESVRDANINSNLYYIKKISKYDNDTLEIGKINSSVAGLHIKAIRTDNKSKLILYMGGYGLYCADLHPEIEIIKLSNKIKEKILQN